MVKGLVIRQAFVIIDVTLAILVLAVAYFVIAKVFEPPTPTAAGPNALPDSAGVSFAKVKPRGEYDVIIGQKIFGDVGQWSQDAVVVEPEKPPATDPITKLPWKLHGTAAAFPLDSLGTATIEVPSAKPPRSRIDVYFVDSVVFDQIKLVEIYPRRVVLYNEAQNTREILEMDDSQIDGLLASLMENTEAAAAPEPAEPLKTEFKLKKSDVMQEITTRGEEIVTMLQAELQYDANGDVQGVTSKNLSKIPMAKNLGLKDNDVVQSVNGNKIDGPDALWSLLPKLQSSSEFKVQVMRNGKPIELTYKLEE